MAATAVSVTIQKISQLLTSEATFLAGVRDDVENLQTELNRMQKFLKDVEHKQGQDDRVRNMVAEIRDLAYDAEDVIETFILQIANRKVGLYRCFNSCTKPFHLHKIGTKIESIRDKLANISNSLQTYSISLKNEGERSSEMQRRHRRTDPDHQDKDIIGLDDATDVVVAQLMTQEDQVRVVSIVGMGGLGKTTLAKKVYNHINVKHHFDCRSWAFISHEFSVVDVLSGILKEIAPTALGTEKLTEDELVKRLKGELKEKQYLVVLDDMWKEDAWLSLKQAFPEGKKGSKILLTTRNREVALYADQLSSPVEPPFLTDEQGWKLLSKKAFLKDDSKEFERLGKEMVRKCGALPLAIEVLGGLLANKPLNEWQVAHRDVNAKFIKLQERSQHAGIEWIIALSYHDLPLRLRPCFLYLCQFPEGYEICKKKLLRMWIAEGFIPKPSKGEGHETMEDVAEQYLQELVGRFMVQVSKRDHTGTAIKRCCMHNLVREMCLQEATDQSFLGIIEHQENKQDEYPHVISQFPRKVAVRCNFTEALHYDLIAPVQICGRRIRSLLYVVPEYYVMKGDQVISIFKNFKVLRVLNLQNINLHPGYLPSEIGNLIHLRYLGLNNTGLGEKYWPESESPTLSKSIGNLKMLYTLDLRKNSIEVPDVLWRLANLRHLLLAKDTSNRFQLDTLKNLETLKWVDANNLIIKKKDEIVKDVIRSFINLRDLAIKFEDTEKAKVVLGSYNVGLVRLRSLKIEMSTAGFFANLKALSDCYDLKKLQVSGKIVDDRQATHQSLKFLPESLTELILKGCHLKKDPMDILEKLPNLRYLFFLEETYMGSKMVCSSGGFKQLEVLKFSWVSQLEEWEIKEGAMPSLKTLALEYLHNLKSIPEGLKFVTTLQELRLLDFRDEFRRRLQGKDGEDFDKVCAVPFIVVRSLDFDRSK